MHRTKIVHGTILNMADKAEVTSNASAFLHLEDRSTGKTDRDDDAKTTVSEMFMPKKKVQRDDLYGAKHGPSLKKSHDAFDTRRHGHRHSESDDSDDDRRSRMHMSKQQHSHGHRHSDDSDAGDDSDETKANASSDEGSDISDEIDPSDISDDDDGRHHRKLRKMAKKMAKKMFKRYRHKIEEEDESNEDDEPHDPKERILLRKRKLLSEIKEYRGHLGSIVELDPERCPEPTSASDSLRIVKQEWDFWRKMANVEEQKGTLKDGIKLSISLLQKLFDKYDILGMSLYGIMPQVSELLDRKDRLIEGICRKFSESVSMEPEMLLFSAILFLVGTHIVSGHGHELKRIDEAKKRLAKERSASGASAEHSSILTPEQVKQMAE